MVKNWVNKHACGWWKNESLDKRTNRQINSLNEETSKYSNRQTDPVPAGIYTDIYRQIGR